MNTLTEKYEEHLALLKKYYYRAKKCLETTHYNPKCFPLVYDAWREYIILQSIQKIMKNPDKTVKLLLLPENISENVSFTRLLSLAREVVENPELVKLTAEAFHILNYGLYGENYILEDRVAKNSVDKIMKKISEAIR